MARPTMPSPPHSRDRTRGGAAGRGTFDPAPPHRIMPRVSGFRLLGARSLTGDGVGAGSGQISGQGGKGWAMVTREEVVWAYRMLLGREPEDEAAIEAHCHHPDIDSLRRTFLGSEEFSGPTKVALVTHRLRGY